RLPGQAQHPFLRYWLPEIHAQHRRMTDPDIDRIAVFEPSRRMIDGNRHDGKDSQQHAILHGDEQGTERDSQHPGQKPAAFMQEDGEGVAWSHDTEQGTEERGQRTEDREQSSLGFCSLSSVLCFLSSVFCPLFSVLCPLSSNLVKSAHLVGHE